MKNRQQIASAATELNQSRPDRSGFREFKIRDFSSGDGSGGMTFAA